jgi:hypothetical protein
MAVHDIHMDIIGPGLFQGPDLIAEAAEIGGKNGRGDLHNKGSSFWAQSGQSSPKIFSNRIAKCKLQNANCKMK